VNSTGNDIVALAAIDKSRTRHRRFYSKILSDAERTLFDGLQPAGMPFEIFVWLLWSIKESVYKYLKRTQPGLVFSPTRTGIRTIEVPAGFSDEDSCIYWESRVAECGKDSYKGIAFFESHIFYFRSRVHPDFIATVVDKEENFKNTWWGVRPIGHSDYNSQSSAVRTFVLNKLNTVLSAKERAAGMPVFTEVEGAREWQIGKSGQGYPLVFQGEEEMAIPLSFAHHGNFVSYSFYLDTHL
jgi:4'-phosphopantetheinyl transferase superfamily